MARRTRAAKGLALPPAIGCWPLLSRVARFELCSGPFRNFPPPLGIEIGGRAEPPRIRARRSGLLPHGGPAAAVRRLGPPLG